MTPLRALVCDDEAPLCDSMARRVEKLGLQVDKAQDGLLESSRVAADSIMPSQTALPSKV